MRRPPAGTPGRCSIAGAHHGVATMLRVLLPAIAIASGVTAAAQTSVAAFEVASVRVNREVSDRPTLMRLILQPGGRVLMRNQTVEDVIVTAYGVRPDQVAGGPDWIRSTGFDLEARGAADTTAETARAMLRALLADRFSLELHREQRERPIYVLTMAESNGRPGPRLRPASSECAAVIRPGGMAAGPPLPPPPTGVTEAVPLGVAGPRPRCESLFRSGHFSGRAVSMDRLADELTESSGRPVVNRTGLTGEFDLELRYTADLAAEPPPDAAIAPGLATALREQLGLRLEGARGPVEVLVIDRALMPTEN